MPDHDPISPGGESLCTEGYPNPAPRATPSFCEKLRSEIQCEGSLPFPKFLDLALYDPEQGYYARSSSQVGRGGDFYTSVSVGSLFGKLLAGRFLAWWEENGRPREWRIVEIGAHDGTLAADILVALKSRSEAAWTGLQYAIPEPLPRLREAQRGKLAHLAADLHITAYIGEIAASTMPGIAFGNEILDALPFHLLQKISGKWYELAVAAGSSGALEFLPIPIPGNSPLRQTDVLSEDLPDGYRTEVRTNYLPLLSSLSSCLEDGLLLFFDYGFAAPEYYDSQRITGTLRTFSNHQATENPLDRPGEIDITAHVDFTCLAKSAVEIGYAATEFSSQGSYLTHLAKNLILSGGIADAHAIAQFQSLTHPAHLGAKFHAIEFTKGAETPPTIRHRLAM